MAFIDGTAVNVALPALQSSLHATISEVQWVVEAYTLLLGALLLTGGSLGDLFGQRKVFGLGVAVFAVACVWCGLAPDITQLIVARAVQGVGGAMLVPCSLAWLSVSFDRAQLGRAIGIWSGFTSITSALGPLLGGLLAQHESWRWVFFINVPIAVIVLGIVIWRTPQTEGAPVNASVDWLGALLTTVGLGAIVYGFLESSTAVGLIGVAALVAFLLVEVRGQSPMLPLSIFQSKDFSGACLLTLFVYGALSGALFFFPLNLVQVQGYSESAAGAALLPFILLIAILSRWSASLVERYSARTLLIAGPLIAAAGFVLFCLPSVGGSYWVTFFPAVTVLGLGMAVTVAPLTTTVMGSVEEKRVGIASGINNATSRVAGLISIALFGLLLRVVFSDHLDRSLGSLQAASTEAGKLRSTLAVNDVAGNLRRVANDSFVAGFRVLMWVSAGCAAAGAASSFALIGRRKPR